MQVKSFVEISLIKLYKQMRSKPFLLLALSTLLCAEEVPIRIYTLELEAQKDKIHARKQTVVEYKDYYIQCDKAVYDDKKKIVKLYGDIFVLDDNRYSTYANYAILDLKSNRILTKPFFFSDLPSLLWVAGSKLDLQKGKLELRNSFISSCDTRCGDWKIFFEKGKYEKEKSWIDLYNVKLYAKDKVIFYFPYLGFSTLRKRHTGLLRPKVGLSNREGLVYVQPFFYAPTNWWDFELDPQIRTNRGTGVYGTFRFVDSLYSFGSLTAGYFKERDDYFREYKLKNDTHYGVDLFYKRRWLITQHNDPKAHDGLYIQLHNYNDVDYYNLQKTDLVEGTHSIVTSRMNYYYNHQDDYFGVYAKYFKDNTKTDNSTTLQLLPSLQYHRYVTNLLNNKHLYYNVNLQVNHFSREKGLNAIEYQVDIPLRFNYSFLDELLGLSFSENLFLNYADYNFIDKNLNKKWQNSYVYRNVHEISLYSDLVKKYQTFFHTLHLDTTLSIPSYEKVRGDQAPFINIGHTTKRINFSLKQYFYNGSGVEKWYHKVVQPVEYEESDKWLDFENEIGFWLGDELLVNNYIFFSHQRNQLVSSVTTLEFNDDKSDLYLSHFYKDRVKGERDSNFLRFQATRALSKKYKLFGTIDYDLIDDKTRNWSLGWRMQKRCWSYEVRYQKELVPLLTNLGTDSYVNHSVYFRVELYPLGGVSNSIRTVQRQRIF